MATASAQVFFERYKQLNSLEQQKDGLIEDLLQRVNELEEAFRQEKLDHERETRFNRDIQIHEMELMQHISRIKNIMDREPFIIVLLDGDGIIFKDEFLREGERGGRDAANQLSTALDDFVTSNFPSITSPKIMMRIYANVKGLSELCVRAGIISEQSLFYDFIRGFNKSTALFDYVDVGTEKGSANDKIGGMRVHPSLFLALRKGIPRVPEANILLGCSHDDGYIQILENTLADMDLTGRVSLIEGTAFEKDMESIKASYRITKFPDIFRDTKITTPVWAPWKAAVTTAPPKPQSVLTPSPSQYAASLTRRSANSTPSNNSRALSSSSLSTSQNSSDFQVVPTKASKQKPPKTVERNKYGQRVDRLDFRSIPREDLNRIKKMKLCNYHFLLGECPNTNCYHDHTHKLTKDEYYILTAIARMTPCHWGLDCDDPECIYGHRCPQSEPGRKDCYWGSNCRFDTAAHGIDTNIVKVTKV